MSEHDRTFEFSGYETPEQVATYLETLAGQIRSGRVFLASGAEMIHLAMGTNVKVEIEAEDKVDKGKCKLVWELSWRAPLQMGESLPAGPATGDISSLTLI